MTKISTAACESAAESRGTSVPISPNRNSSGRRSPGRSTHRRARNDYRQTVIDEITRQIESRLRGDVHEFRISITDDDRYRLEGWCARYHVKQMAQHLAMHLVSEGKLINEIQVRTIR